MLAILNFIIALSLLCYWLYLTLTKRFKNIWIMAFSVISLVSFLVFTAYNVYFIVRYEVMNSANRTYFFTGGYPEYEFTMLLAEASLLIILQSQRKSAELDKLS